MPGLYDHVLNLLGRWRIASDAREARQAFAARHPRSSAFSKALPPQHRASPRVTVGFDAFPAARRMANQRAARISINDTVGQLARLERETRAMLADAAGERRARIRAGVEDILRRAMEGVARGEITAVEIAKLEGQAMRVIAAIEPGPAVHRGVA
jgi:hypothetical protein